MLVVAVQAGKACWRVVMCSSEAHKLRATEFEPPLHESLRLFLEIRRPLVTLLPSHVFRALGSLPLPPHASRPCLEDRSPILSRGTPTNSYQSLI